MRVSVAPATRSPSWRGAPFTIATRRVGEISTAVNRKRGAAAPPGPAAPATALKGCIGSRSRGSSARAGDAAAAAASSTQSAMWAALDTDPALLEAQRLDLEHDVVARILARVELEPRPVEMPRQALDRLEVSEAIEVAALQPQHERVPIELRRAGRRDLRRRRLSLGSDPRVRARGLTLLGFGVAFEEGPHREVLRAHEPEIRLPVEQVLEHRAHLRRVDEVGGIDADRGVGLRHARAQRAHPVELIRHAFAQALGRRNDRLVQHLETRLER